MGYTFFNLHEVFFMDQFEYYVCPGSAFTDESKCRSKHATDS